MSRYHGGAEEEKGKVSVWLRTGRVPDGISNVFDEQYDDDNALLNPFSGAFKFYYDHDYSESGGGLELQPVADCFQSGSYIASYREAAIKVAQKRGITQAHGKFALFDHVYLVGKTKVRDALGYTFLGVFDFKRG